VPSHQTSLSLLERYDMSGDSVELDISLENGSSNVDNKQGTFYQFSTGLRSTKRKHFFSPLDHALPDAVHKDAADVEFTPEEEVCSLECT
jgi:hypothetical protein